MPRKQSDKERRSKVSVLQNTPLIYFQDLDDDSSSPQFHKAMINSAKQSHYNSNNKIQSNEICEQKPSEYKIEKDDRKIYLDQFAIIENIWQQSVLSIEKCICSSQLITFEDGLPKVFCYRCGRMYHQQCFWSQYPENISQCPFCFLRNCLPNYKTIAIIWANYLPLNNFYDKKPDKYQIFFEIPHYFFRNKKYRLQARCLKLTNSHRFTITWPDNCQIILNKIQTIKIKPIQSTSPLQRRYDEPIKFQKEAIMSSNTLTIQNLEFDYDMFKRTEQSDYILALMIVEEIDNEEIMRNFLGNILPINQSQQLLKRNLSHKFNDLSVESISISGKCQFFGTKIKYPARSKLCQNHYQPFDAQNMIYSALNAKHSSRKWTCPICNRRAYDIVIDEYLLKIMQLQKIKEIQFNSQYEQPQLEFDMEEYDTSYLSHKNSEKQISIQRKQQLISHMADGNENKQLIHQMQGVQIVSKIQEILPQRPSYEIDENTSKIIYEILSD